MYRDNAGVTAKLVCPGGQIDGVASDVSTAMTTTGGWEQVSISFTPTVTDVVEIFVYAYGGTTYNVWVDDLSIT
jgi:hypothetical protein